jgi:hypothetical protein
MQLLPPSNPDSKLKQIARAYGELIVRCSVFILWTVIAFAVCCMGYLVIFTIWRFLILALKAVRGF